MCGDRDVSAVFRTAAAPAPGAGMSGALEVTNTSDRPCTMDGYASFWLVDSAGHATRRGTSTGEVFSGFDLAPGRRASAAFTWKQCAEGRPECVVGRTAGMTLELSRSVPAPTLDVRLEASPIAMGADAELNAWRPVE